MLPWKKTRLIGLLSLAILLLAGKHTFDGVVGIPLALAAPATESIFSGVTTALSLFLVVFNFIAFLIYPMLEVILDPTFFLEIFAANAGILQTIWSVSRNIMNLLFAVILMGIAIMTVVTAKREIIGKYAVKFVLAVILVNFSWFFPRVILDIATVTTATIYKLPDLTNTLCQVRDGNVLRQCEFPYDFKFFREAEAITRNNGQPQVAPFNIRYKCPIPNIVCHRTVVLNPNVNAAGGILAGLVMNHGRLHNMARISAFIQNPPNNNLVDWVTFFVQLINTLFFTLAVSVALMLAMLAMFVAFLIRIPVLWITTAFMPFMFLSYVIGDLPLLQRFNTMKIFESFVKAAFLPAVVAVPLSVGFMVLNALSAVDPALIANQLAARQAGLPMGLQSLWQILWMITTILIIWKGFFMALSIDELYANATSGIKTFGGNLGTIAKSLPLNIPLIPAPRGGQPMTLGGIRGGLGSIAGLAQAGQLNKANLQRFFNPGAASGKTEPPVSGLPVPNPANVKNISTTITSTFNKNMEQAININGGIRSEDGLKQLAQTLSNDVTIRGQNLTDVVNGLREAHNSRVGATRMDDETLKRVTEALRATGQFR